jgi:hypothetical protein
LAFLQGVLRFPQRFRMVFCGEVVVVWWWKRGSWKRIFVCLKMRHVLRFIFWVDFWKSKGNSKSKGNNFVAAPFGPLLRPSAERNAPFGFS